ncbi:MAG: ATP-binding protein [Clostridia bacterium]|nr:ATP-binding protein [Clostridia bacterium]
MYEPKQLTVLRNLCGNPLVYCLLNIEKEGRDAFLGEIYARGAETDILGYLSALILRDENAFSLACAKGERPSKYVVRAYRNDVKTIFDAAQNAERKEGEKDFRLGKQDEKLTENTEENLVAGLMNFHLTNGYGDFIGNRAFDYDGEKLVPIENVAKTRLSDLKDYEDEKRQVMFNTENFLSGFPFYNTLLYGDRGTGKSSTVQAITNEYAERGLRLIQLDKKYIGRLDEVRKLVRGLKLKFILFIDDLTLSHDDPSLPAFKAALEGTMYDWDNCMVVATSNRRHIIHESFSDRDGDIHPGDAKEDIISLSDRFGLTVMFSSTGREGYLSIVTQLAEDYSLKTKEITPLAERWALYHGGRSPRVAKQFCLYALACENTGRKIDF